jgi:hypothetical protein
VSFLDVVVRIHSAALFVFHEKTKLNRLFYYPPMVGSATRFLQIWYILDLRKTGVPQMRGPSRAKSTAKVLEASTF